MPLLNYTTKVDVYATLGAIQGQLVKHGAKKIMAIEADAQCAYGMCKDTALKEQVELDFVLEKFLTAFKKIVEKGEDHG